MARPCSVCVSSRRSQIDVALAGGETLSAIGRRFKISRDAARRHREAHLSPALTKVAIERYGAESALTAFDATVGRLESLIERLEALLGVAEDRKSLIGASNLAREIRQSLELVARLRGELTERPVVAINVLASPEVAAYTSAIARIAANHPEIRAEIVREFESIPAIIDAEVVE